MVLCSVFKHLYVHLRINHFKHADNFMLIIKYEHKNNIYFSNLKYHLYFYRACIYYNVCVVNKCSNPYCYNKQLCVYIIYYDVQELLTFKYY